MSRSTQVCALNMEPHKQPILFIVLCACICTTADQTPSTGACRRCEYATAAGMQ
jgi:hypothetical protein